MIIYKNYEAFNIIANKTAIVVNFEINDNYCVMLITIKKVNMKLLAYYNQNVFIYFFK